MLAGSWRSTPPPIVLDQEVLEAALALAARTNAAALIWWRLAQTAFASLPAVETLHDTYRYHALQAVLQEVRLRELLQRLSDASIESILIKGWSVARLYPQSGLRPYEDIDLVVRPCDLQRAQAALNGPGSTDVVADFDHTEIYAFDRPDWNGLFERSRTLSLDTDTVRVLSPEDHLRVICLHSLKHCMSNPLWLCDIAISIEAAGSDFDWDRCFGSRAPQNQWIGCAIGLARDLLGCELPPEAARRADIVPRWLAPTVFEMWVRWAMFGKEERPLAIREVLAHPAHIFSMIAARWPNQVEVCLTRGAPLADTSAWIQWAYEFAHLFAARRIVEAVVRISPALRRPSATVTSRSAAKPGTLCSK